MSYSSQCPKCKGWLGFISTRKGGVMVECHDIGDDSISCNGEILLQEDSLFALTEREQEQWRKTTAPKFPRGNLNAYVEVRYGDDEVAVYLPAPVVDDNGVVHLP